MTTIADMTDAELDVAVAREVMGWTEPLHVTADCEKRRGGRTRYWLIGTPPICTICNGRNLPRFSTDIAAAFEVVEAMRGRGYWWEMRCPCQRGDDRHIARFEMDADVAGPYTFAAARHASLPRAICKAALEAVRAES